MLTSLPWAVGSILPLLPSTPTLCPLNAKPKTNMVYTVGQEVRPWWLGVRGRNMKHTAGCDCFRCEGATRIKRKKLTSYVIGWSDFWRKKLTLVMLRQIVKKTPIPNSPHLREPCTTSPHWIKGYVLAHCQRIRHLQSDISHNAPDALQDHCVIIVNDLRWKQKRLTT